MANYVKMGQSVERMVFDIVASDLAMKEALHYNYANLSALARILQDMIEEKFGKRASITAIVSALKRARRKIDSGLEDIYPVLAKSSVSVKTNVAKVSFSSHSVGLALKLLQRFEENFIHLSKSLKSITLIFDEAVYSQIVKAAKSAGVFEMKRGLAAITVHSPREIVETPGCINMIYGTLVKADVNIEDTTSCYTDTIIVVDMKDVERAFASLTDLITYSRKVVRIL